MTKKLTVKPVLENSIQVSPHLFQQTALSSLSLIDLELYLMEVTEKNPFFVFSSQRKQKSLFPRLAQEYEDIRGGREGLEEDLLSEIREELLGMPLSKKEKWIGEIIISSLLPDGMMSIPLQSVASYVKEELAFVQKIFERLQSLFPSIRENNSNPVFHTLKMIFPNPVDLSLAVEYWEALWNKIPQSSLGSVSLEEIREEIQQELLARNIHSHTSSILKKVDLALSDLILAKDLFENSSREQAVVLKPDVLIKLEGDKLDIEMWDEWHFELASSKKPSHPASLRLWEEAKHLIGALRQQEIFLHRLIYLLVSRQEGFFKTGAPLKVLYQKDIAKELNSHPSSVSRTLREKTFFFQGHILPLKDLVRRPSKTSKGEIFSPQTLLRTMQDILTSAGQYRISDRLLQELLTYKDIHISRRTVNKYRKMLPRQ